jgi:arylsulfatase A-like enzyme
MCLNLENLHQMHRRNLFCLTVAILPLIVVACNQRMDDASIPGNTLPNVILVMADDLGYGDVACYGNPVVKTPHLDAMAQNGIRFNRFYSGAPVCSPTRGSCLTGRHPYRYGIPWAGRHPLPEVEITLAEALKSIGYSTGHFGKWHLGGLSRTIIQSEFPDGPSPYSPPWENGFDESFSTESMVPTYNPYYHVGGKYHTNEYRHVQTEPVVEGQRTGGNIWKERYWTGPGQVVDEWLEGDDSKIIMDRALSFIDKQSRENIPFLAVIWFHAPHTPVVAGNEFRNLYPEQPIEKQHWFGSITAMDEQVGRLRSHLLSNGIAENTILWFCSDNGPSYIHENNSAGPLRGKKSELYEGGIRVPAIMEWPVRFQNPMIVDIPVSTSDFYPTILAITNTVMDGQPALDGENILPILEERTDRRAPIGFLSPLPSKLRKQETRNEEQFALIDSQYKIISMDNGISFQLYDLTVDQEETTDLSSEHSDILKDMKDELLAWIRSCKEDFNQYD